MRQDTGGAPPRCYVAREGRWQVIGPVARLSSLAEERLGGGLRLAPRASADIQASRLASLSPTLLTVSRVMPRHAHRSPVCAAAVTAVRVWAATAGDGIRRELAWVVVP